LSKARLVLFKAFIDEHPYRTIRLGLVWRNLESRYFIEQLAQGTLRTAASKAQKASEENGLRRSR
jgi:hypothetical protein